MASHGDPLVTVLTPVYNGEEYLAECIDSVLGQTYGSFEYIIVNNCSTDRSLEIAQQYVARDPRVRIHTNEEFVGVIENHNKAFRLVSSSARYCKVVSADDFIFPDCLRQMVDFAEKNPSVGYVGAYQLSGHIIKWQGFRYPQAVFPGRELCRQVILRRQAFLDDEPVYGFGTPTSLLYRADIVAASDAFYPNPSPHSDTSACFRDLDRCDFGFVYQVLSFERTHAKTQTSKSIDMGRHASAYLNDLLTYGPHFLSDDELRHAINAALDEYHRFLAKNVFKSRDGEFWEYHHGRLQELGFPLSRGALLKAALRAGVVRASGRRLDR